MDIPKIEHVRGALPVNVFVERRAWFDLNGDGRIDNVPVSDGGDAYMDGDSNGNGHIDTGPITRMSTGAPNAPHPLGETSTEKVERTHPGELASSAQVANGPGLPARQAPVTMTAAPVDPPGAGAPAPPEPSRGATRAQVAAATAAYRAYG
jgi:hypothetical protein